jgi:hypothetical protein
MQSGLESKTFDPTGSQRTRALLKKALLQRLEAMGVEASVIPWVLRSLSGVYRTDRNLSTYEANHRLKYLGWSDIELDHYTWQLAVDFFLEAAGAPLKPAPPQPVDHA